MALLPPKENAIASLVSNEAIASHHACLKIGVDSEEDGGVAFTDD